MYLAWKICIVICVEELETRDHVDLIERNRERIILSLLRPDFISHLDL